MKTILLTIRKLRKNRTATSLGIASLVVGLVCVMYIFLWVTDEISYDRFHANSKRIFGVHAYLKGENGFKFAGCPPAVGPALKNDFPEVENSCRYSPPYRKILLSYNNQKFMEQIAMADFSLFDIFSFPFVQGGKGEENLPNKIIFTESAAKRYFGTEDPVGKVVVFDNKMPYTVAGVIRDIPANSSIRFEVVVPLETLCYLFNNPNFLNTWYNNALTTYGLLRNAEDYEKIAAEITNRIQKEIPESISLLRAYLFKNKYLYEQNHIRNVRIFSLIALLVLVTAILNFINLSTARSEKSAKESTLRKIVGATRRDLIRLIYSDIAIVCVMAFLTALILAFAGLPFFNQLVDKNIRFSILFSFIPVLGIVLIYAFTVLLSGSYPAFLLSSSHQSLITGHQSVKGKKHFRNVLVIMQFVFSMILLSSTLIIGKQTRFMEKMDVGLAKDEILYIPLNGQLKKQYKVLKSEISRLSGVASTCVTSAIPSRIGNNDEGWNWDGKNPDFKPLVTRWNTDDDLLKTFQIALNEGSVFSLNPNEIMINKRFADMIGWNQFEGKTISNYGANYQIKGVINDFNFNSLYEATLPLAIFPMNNIEDWAQYYLMIRLGSSNVVQALDYIRKTCEKIEPKYPVNYSFLNDEYNKLIASELNLTQLISIFSAFAIIVLILGLLGLIIFMAEQKTKEIGVRKYMGESVASIVVRFLKPFFLTGFIASVIAIPLSWYIMDRWLQNYALRIQLNILEFIAAGFIAIVIAILTVSWQSWKAATRNPVEALRYE